MVRKQLSKFKSKFFRIILKFHRNIFIIVKFTDNELLENPFWLEILKRNLIALMLFTNFRVPEWDAGDP